MTDKQIPLQSGILGRGIDLAARVTGMLRVITDRHGDRYRLDLHGTLGGEWVAVLEQHWRSITEGVPSAKVTLVLANVGFIDPDGERLLHRMAGEGVTFVVDGCLNRYVVDSLNSDVPAAEGGRR